MTCWELEKAAVPHTLICDSMAASLMQKKQIDQIFIGADRITKNFDVANKIGSYSLAVLANYHKIPFVVAPSTNFDENLNSGEEIEIEKRPASEVRGISKASTSFCGQTQKISITQDLTLHLTHLLQEL